MNALIRFLTEKKHFYSLYLVFGLLCFAGAWFVTQTPNPSVHSAQAVPVRSSEGPIAPSALNVSKGTSQQLDALRRRVVNAPDDTTHIYRLARMLQNAHQTEEAMRNYRHYLAMRPQNRQAWLDYEQTLAEQKLWHEAQEAVETMLIHYPDDPSGLYNLGAIHANQSRIEEAESIWKRVAAQTIDSGVAEMAQTSLQRLKSFVKPQWVEAK